MEKEQKKLEKKLAKKAKESEHKAKEGKAVPQKPKSAEAKAVKPAADDKSPETEEQKESYGDFVIINSSVFIERTFTSLGKLDESIAGEEVWVRARIHNSRAQGRVRTGRNLTFNPINLNKIKIQMNLTIKKIYPQSFSNLSLF